MWRGSGPGALVAAALLFVALHAQNTYSKHTKKTVSKRSISDIDPVAAGAASDTTTEYDGTSTERDVRKLPITSDVKPSLRTPAMSSEVSHQNDGVLLNNENSRSGTSAGALAQAEAAWDYGALPYGTGYIAGPPPLTSVQTKADATIELLSSGTDPYSLGSNDPDYSIGKLRGLLQGFSPMNAAQAAGLGEVLPAYVSSQAQANAQRDYNYANIPQNIGANMRAQYIDTSQNSRLIPRNELIYLQNVPGAENLVKCSKEAEFHHVVINSKQCLVCACIRTGFLLHATCASCAGCARAEPSLLYDYRPIDQYLPQLHLHTYPGTVPGILGRVPGPAPGYPGAEPGYPGAGFEYPNPISEYLRPRPGALACAPLPTGVPFEHPLNPCQMCICDVSIFNKSDTSIACLENPQCVTPVDIPSLPSTPHHSIPVSTPLCQMFPKNVFFPHPSDNCKKCKCFEEVPELKILCIPEQNCGFASILPFLPSILPSQSYLPHTMTSFPDGPAGVEHPTNIIQPDFTPKIKDDLPFPSEPGKYPNSPDSFAEAFAYSPDLLVSSNNINPLLPGSQKPFAPAYTNVPSTSPLPHPIPSVPTVSGQAIDDSKEEPILVPYVGQLNDGPGLFPTQSPQPLIPTVSPQFYPTFIPPTTTALDSQVPGSTPIPAGAPVSTPSLVSGALPWPPVTDINQEYRGPLLGPPPHESCRPYPANTTFQHPWSDCQVCRCNELHSAGHVSIEVNCYTKPECCIVPPPTTVSINAQSEELQLLDKLCEYKTFGVEFTDPRDSCRLCRCQVRGRFVAPTCRDRCKTNPLESTTNFGVSSNWNPGSSVFTESNELYNSKPYSKNLASVNQQNSVSAVAGAVASVELPSQDVPQNSLLLNPLQSNVYPTNSPPFYGYQNGIVQGPVGAQPGLYPPSTNQYYTTPAARLPTSNNYEMGTNGIQDSYSRGVAAASASSSVNNYLPPTSFEPPVKGLEGYGFPSYATNTAKVEAMSAAYSTGSNAYYSTAAPDALAYLRSTAKPTAWDTTTPSISQGDSSTEAWAKALAAAGAGAKVTRSDGARCQYAGDRYHARCQPCYCLRGAGALYAMCLGEPCS